MLRIISNRIKPNISLLRTIRSISNFSSDNDERLLRNDINLTGVALDEIDQIMNDEVLKPMDNYYPKLDVDPLRVRNHLDGHNLVVLQPWTSYTNFSDNNTDPELQLEECVSLGNTIQNWHVVGKKIVYSNSLNRKHVVGPGAFEELKDLILGHKGVSAVMFGLELLSGIQLTTLERELQMPVYDRFTVVLNIFRQHARTKESKIQLALAELPYIKANLREIHESSEYSSTAESLKILVGGMGEKFYHQRLKILNRREAKLKYLLEQIRRQRDITRRQRKKFDVPIVAVVGYTNSGKTSLIKCLTQDEKLVPEDKLFATLDITVHAGQLPSSKNVLYLDTVGFISRIPTLLVEAFSATLREVQESDLILHVLDVTHPDHRLQYATVINALNSLKIPKTLLETRLTIGNKVDLKGKEELPESLPTCDIHVSATENTNLQQLAEKINKLLMTNLQHEELELKIENGGSEFSWLRKNATIVDCKADENDGNYLICRVIMSPVAKGRWFKSVTSKSAVSSKVSKLRSNKLQ